MDAKTEEAEAQFDISDRTITYGLHSFRYGTSEFLSTIFTHLDLKPGTTFYDLGSGYGKVIVYGALLFPEVQFKGIEILEERYKISDEAIQLSQLSNASVIHADLLLSDISDGDVFYIYNPLFEFQYPLLMDLLKKAAADKTIIVIAESRCDVFDAQEWLINYYEEDRDVLRKIRFYTNA